MRAILGRLAGRWPAITGGLWGLLVLAWLHSVVSRQSPGSGTETLAVLAFLATLLCAGRWLLAAGRRCKAGDASGVALAAALGVSLAVRLVGIEHEVVERYYLDEGTYAQHSRLINQGELLVRDFIYPHLLYYLEAFGRWTAALFAEPVQGLTEALYGIDRWADACRVINRWLVAAASAATVIPVFHLARQLGGLRAALLAAALVVFSPLFNRGSHLAISDVPSAVLATFSLMFAARLLTGERLRWYLLAGAFAGLAAAAKYPAGLVAVAIVALWIRGRLVTRRFSFSLAAAGLAAVGAFLAANPGLLAYPERAFFGPRDMFSGARQYGGEGWLGVIPQSQAEFYLRQLAASFGPAVLVLGTLGLLLVGRARGRPLLWLLPFPAVYMGTILSMTVAVPRNLHPVLPILAVFLGVGTAELARRAGDRAGGRGAIAVVVLCLAQPVVATGLQSAALCRPGTRVVAREWIRANVPRGARILREDYTPSFRRQEYADWKPAKMRFVGALPLERIRRPETDLLLLSDAAWGRFFRRQHRGSEELEPRRSRYAEIFATFPVVRRFEPSRTRLGPALTLYRVPPEPLVYLREKHFEPREAFVPSRAMAGGGKNMLTFPRDHLWCMVKGLFRAGGYTLEVAGEIPSPGQLVVRTLDNRTVASAALAGGEARLEIPADAKLFFYLHLPRGSEISGISLRPAETS